MTNAWPRWEKSKTTVFPACNSWLNFRVRGQFEIKLLIVRHINTTYFMSLKKKNYTWACDHLKTSNCSTKKILDLDGWTPEPTIRSSDTGQRISCFDSRQLITTLMCNMCTISVFLCSQTCQKVRLTIGMSVVRTDGRSFVRCTVTWLPNFLGWVDLLTHGAPLARASHPRAPLFNLQSAAYSSLPQHGTFVYRGEVFNRDHFFLSVKNCGLLQFAFLFPQYVELFVWRFGHLGAYLFVYRCRYNAWK